MKIQDWENYVTQKYNAQKIDNFLELKKHLSDPAHYAHNFTPEELTETIISNDEYYSAYVFDESVIAKREVQTKYESCWNKLIVFLGSVDNVNISNYCINCAGGLTEDESSKFYHDINPLEDSTY